MERFAEQRNDRKFQRPLADKSATQTEMWISYAAHDGTTGRVR
jgi:hypothetical protein